MRAYALNLILSDHDVKLAKGFIMKFLKLLGSILFQALALAIAYLLYYGISHSMVAMDDAIAVVVLGALAAFFFMFSVVLLGAFARDAS